MGTAAVGALRLRRATPARERRATCGLGFHETGGPVVAVCGLVGGAATTTLALCLANQAAIESTVPVLVTEIASRAGDLAVYSGHASGQSFSEVAQLVACQEAIGPPFVEAPSGLRLLAAHPGRTEERDVSAEAALVADAKAAHGLVVMDCGTLAPASLFTLAAATHVLWTLPATDTATTTAEALLSSDLLPAPSEHREVLVASRLGGASRASVRRLRELASTRCDRLVLVPHSAGLAAGENERLDDGVRRALDALATVLRRGR